MNARELSYEGSSLEQSVIESEASQLLSSRLSTAEI